MVWGVPISTLQKSPQVSAGSHSVGSRWFNLITFGLRYGVIWAFLALLVAAPLFYPRFYELANLRNVLTQNAPIGIVAVGMTFVLIAGGFDLSVGAIFGFAATVYASLGVSEWPVSIGITAAVLVGAVAGLLNAFIITKLKVDAFVATFGTASIIGGLVFLYSGAQPYAISDEQYLILGSEGAWGVPYSVIILLAVFLMGAFVLAKTVFGRSLYAVGGSSEAARVAGLRVWLLRSATFVVVGVCAALAGVLIASRLGTGQADMVYGTTALDAIAIVVVGGTSLFGGDGSMWRTAVGLGVLAVLNNLFDSLAVDNATQLVTKGSVIIAAVALDTYTRQRT